ncbi:MAG: hypothetical protein WA220_07915 [Candidatus Nitrosopolaris sp.]
MQVQVVQHPQIATQHLQAITTCHQVEEMATTITEVEEMATTITEVEATAVWRI